MIKYLTELIKNKISTIISISFGIFVWVIINRIPQVVNAYSIGILDGTYEFREFPLAVFKFGIQVSPLVFTFVYILSYIINKKGAQKLIDEVQKEKIDAQIKTIILLHK